MGTDIVKDQEYYENLDKRTKEYKEWKANFDASSVGLGDSIEKVTEATGIKKAVKFIAGDDCGCEERKKSLNKLFKYARPNCLSEEQYNELIDVMDSISKSRNRVTKQDQITLLGIYNYVFNAKMEPTSCSSCIRTAHTALNRYLKSYE